MKNKAYHYLYKIISLIPGKPYYYFGKHSTDNIEDSYFGSGTRLIATLKKYGKENFKKEILGFYLTDEELCKAEKDLIGNLYETDHWCLNLKEGGTSGFVSDEVRQKMSEIKKGKPQSPETIKKRSETIKKKYQDPEYLEKRQAFYKRNSGEGNCMKNPEIAKRHKEVCNTKEWRENMSKVAKEHKVGQWMKGRKKKKDE